jgi:hypothetical protein
VTEHNDVGFIDRHFEALAMLVPVPLQPDGEVIVEHHRDSHGTRGLGRQGLGGVAHEI